MSRGPSALVIDDDVGVSLTLQRMLERTGWNVFTATTGAQGIDHVRISPVDIVLADMCLPDISGLRVLDTLRREHPSVPVIILTAYGSVASAVSALKLGASDFVEKPVSSANLLRSIDAVVRAKAAPVPHTSLTLCPPTEQWAQLIVGVTANPSDPTTLLAWARLTGASSGTIKRRCVAVGTCAKKSLDLARVLRAMMHSESSGLPAQVFLDADARTINRLSECAGLSLADSHCAHDVHLGQPVLASPACSAAQFLRKQHFVTNSNAVAALLRLLDLAQLNSHVSGV